MEKSVHAKDKQETVEETCICIITSQLLFMTSRLPGQLCADNVAVLMTEITACTID